MTDAWTTLRVLEWTTARFRDAGIDAARLEAQVLLAHALACNRVALYTQFDKPLGPDELTAYRGLIKRRLAGEPVAYLTGEKEFWSLPFFVDRSVLIPRGDTETVVEVVLDAIADRAAPLRVADVGTGCGALAITLATELSGACCVATDISPGAAELAAKNAARHGVADRVEIRVGDLLAPLAGEPPFDVIVANLPYVPSPEIAGLASEVRSEPARALDGGADGLAVIRRLVSGAGERLAPGGLLVLEHGWNQAGEVARVLADSGAFDPADTRADLAGQARVTFARRLRG